MTDQTKGPAGANRLGPESDNQQAKNSGKRANSQAKSQGFVRPTNAQPDDALVLDDVCAFLGRYIAYPSEHAQIAHTLWLAHTHCMDACESTPRIAFLSPEPGSGKTRALEISELLVPNPIESCNVSAAYLFRKIDVTEGGLPTILYDEVDAVFSGRSEKSEEIRGLLNAGHRRGAKVGRCVINGKMAEPQDYPVFAAVALAGLGWLPDTLMSRSIIIRMRRRAPDEKVEPYRKRYHAADGHELRDLIATWASGVTDELKRARPIMPDEIQDRAADCWEPLLAIADAVGGHWPDTARRAAVALVTLAKEANPSLGLRLLSDLRQVFGSNKTMTTDQLLDRLLHLPESPWADLKGKALDQRGLAFYLRRYDIKPKVLTGGKHRGYERAPLEDAWSRYLPPLSPPEA
jgi:hypothetical protein